MSDRIKCGAPFTIAFEGCDGAGKTLQCKLLQTWMNRKGLSWNFYEFHDRFYAKQLIKNFTEYGLNSREFISASLFLSFMATLEESEQSDVDIALFHRHKFTGLLKDRCHNIPHDLSQKNYSIAKNPDILFF